MTQHTPGPWAIHIEAAQMRFDVNDKVSIRSQDKQVTGQQWASDENLANAKLIAAAPDMLAALQGLMDISEDPGVTYRNAKVAIDKATK